MNKLKGELTRRSVRERPTERGSTYRNEMSHNETLSGRKSMKQENMSPARQIKEESFHSPEKIRDSPSFKELIVTPNSNRKPKSMAINNEEFKKDNYPHESQLTKPDKSESIVVY